MVMTFYLKKLQKVYAADKPISTDKFRGILERSV
jgi:hypothetical protein